MESIMVLGAAVGGRWHAGIGDPTVVGWATVVAYLLGAWACWRIYGLEVEESRLLNPGEADRRPWFWMILALLLVALGINKQMDFQSLLTQVGRDLAHRQGWYSQRRLYQTLFVTAIALGSLASLVFLCWHCRHDWRRRLLALLGTTGLVGFVLIRASSFHHVDQMLGLRLGGLRVNWIIELGGIGCVTLAAVLAGRDVAQTGELSPARQFRPVHPWTDRVWNHDPRWSR